MKPLDLFITLTNGKEVLLFSISHIKLTQIISLGAVLPKHDRVILTKKVGNSRNFVRI